MGCARRVCTRRTRAYLLEWLLTLSVIVVPLACAVFLIPFRNRAISLLDATIQQPYYDKDSLPILSVFIPSVVLPLLCFSLYPFALSRWPRRFGMPPHPFSFHYTYWWSSCLVQAVGLTVLLSELSKRLVQYPRPDFLHRCFPDGVPDAVMTAARNSNYIINTNLCTPPSAAVYEDGLQSFPSEHTSLSWCMAIVLLLFFKTLRRELVSQQMRMSRIMRCRARSARLKNAAAAAAAAGTGVELPPGMDPAAAAALVASGDHHDHSHAFRARLLAATRHALHKAHIPMPIPSPSPELRPPTLMGALPVTCLDESATPLDPDLDSSEMAATDDIEAVQDLPNGVNQELESDPDQTAADADADGEAEAVENGTAASAAAAPSATAASVPGLVAGHPGSGRSVHGRSGSGRSVNGRSGSGRSVHGRTGSGRSVHRRSASGRVLDIPENPPVYMSPFWPNSHLVCIIHGLLPVGWAVAVSLSRAFDHKHNVLDIVAGAFVGIGVAFAVYRMHLIKFQGYHRRWTEGDGDGDADQSDSESDSESDGEQAERTLIRKDGQQQGTEAGRGNDPAVAGTAAAARAGMGMQPGNGGSVNGGDQREQQQLLHPFAIRATTEGDSGRNSTGSTGGVSRSWPPIDPKDGDAQLGPSAKHDRTSKERQSSGEPLAPDMHESAFPRQDYEDRERDQRLDLAGALIRPAAPSQPLAISHPVALPPGLQHYPSAAAGTGACSCAPAQLQHAHSNGAAAPRSM